MAEPARYIDAVGNEHPLAGERVRIVSLVPSITELLFDLDLGGQVVGRTGFCIHPRDAVREVPKIGGTKDVKLEVLRELQPTHVIVNIDENELTTVDQIRQFTPNVIVTHPNAPEDNTALFRLLGGIFQRRAQADQFAAQFEHELAANRAIQWPRATVLYLIWKDPWMTIAEDTYIARTLATVGWHVTTQQGGWAGAARYPIVPDLEAAANAVGHVLLSSEPFMFREPHVRDLRDQLRVPVSLIDGEMTSWYGSRAIRGLQYLRELRAAEVNV
jgi:ABC-type Fe3+-hydroxamate transport system substrate-binding protein